MQKIPKILTISYLVLVVLSVLPIFSGGDPLSGVFAIILTMPWINLLGKLMPASGSIYVGLLLVAVSAGINAAILYYASSWIVKRFAK